MFALFISLIALVLAGIAYWRSGGQRDIETLRADVRRELALLSNRQRAFGEQLTSRVRRGFEDSLGRINRAQGRLAELRSEVSAELQETIDGILERLSGLKYDAERGLNDLRQEVSSDVQATQERVARRVRRLEGHAQILVAKTEVLRAQRLADAHDFMFAEELLQDAVAKTREVKARMSADDVENDEAFEKVLASLGEAIRTVRAQATGARAQIDHVLGESDTLLRWIEQREH